ncbi:hypothetical protein L227DRAFT_577047 [Lentinus tigrinus ALCF2SS1-6]|uniref:Uncharacterized protein n=1 Tax=Lentinus tigrinus ALCF2SS1-6 TaxID=1328759 RepID=A0A5C2S4Y6_9APHY|nr:hypothetical protein L227DRAFT_577047 [Lentinus tigrinus ALCF2SS1-6]
MTIDMHPQIHPCTLVHYAEYPATPYSLADAAFDHLPPAGRAYLLEQARYSPGIPYLAYRIMEQFTKLAAELYHALASTDYMLAQRSAQRNVEQRGHPSSVRPTLGLSFEPIASPKRECVLGAEQRRVLGDWMVRFDALIWLENMASGRHSVAFTQHQQQQRDLQLSRILHDVNRWLVEWDNQGRGCGRRPGTAKVSRKMSAELAEEVSREEVKETGVARRRAKRLKSSQGWVARA